MKLLMFSWFQSLFMEIWLIYGVSRICGIAAFALFHYHTDMGTGDPVVQGCRARFELSVIVFALFYYHNDMCGTEDLVVQGVVRDPSYMSLQSKVQISSLTI